MLKQIRITALVVSIIFIMTACQASESKTSQPEASSSYSSSQKVTVVLPLALSDHDYNEIAADLGQGLFPLEFIGYNKGSGYLDNQAYLDYGLEIGRERDNVVLLFNSPVPSQYAADYFLDITAHYKAQAAEHFTLYADPLNPYGVVTALNDGLAQNQLAVLVRNEYLFDYPDMISTATEYEAFLAWAAVNLTDGRKPGLVRANLYEKAYYNTYVPFEIFLPEYGYLSLTPALPTNIGGLYIKSSETIADVYPLESLAEFKVAALRLAEWMEQGWLDLVDTEKSLADPDHYASIVVNPADYVSWELDYTYPDLSLRIDASEFSIFPLYPDLIPDPNFAAPQPLFYAYVLQGALDPAAFFAFIDWLHNAKSNYQGLPASLQPFFYKASWSEPFDTAPLNFTKAAQQLAGGADPVMQKLSQNRAELRETQSSFWTQSELRSIADREKSYRQLMASMASADKADLAKLLDRFILQQTWSDDLAARIVDLIKLAGS